MDVTAEVMAALRVHEDEKWYEHRDRLVDLVKRAEAAEGARQFSRGYLAGFVAALEVLAGPDLPDPRAVELPPRDFYAGDALAQPDGHP